MIEIFGIQIQNFWIILLILVTLWGIIKDYILNFNDIKHIKKDIKEIRVEMKNFNEKFNILFNWKNYIEGVENGKESKK